VFNGFSNSQRVSKNGGGLQGVMNLLVNSISKEASHWAMILKDKTKRACDLNPDPGFNQNAKSEANLTYSYLTVDFIPTVPVGDTGISELISQMNHREQYINSGRVQEIRDTKKTFYDLRINFINLRGDIQSGSLTRVRYMSKLALEIPPGGSKQQRKALEVLQGLLE
jgi:hypothetical protein